MLAMLPMPNQSSVAAWCEAAPSGFALDESLKDVGDRVNALYIRLFGEKPPFGDVSSSITLRLATDGGQRAKDDARAGAYRLIFSDKEIVIDADDKGIFYALIALAQIWRGGTKGASAVRVPHQWHD